MKHEKECALQLPSDKKVTETATTYFWFEDGILYAISKGNSPTIKDVRDNIETMKKLLGGKKGGFIVDTSKTNYYTIEMRNVFTKALPDLFTAVALVPCKPIGRIIGSILFMRKKHFPVRIFEKLEDAREWIKQFPN